ncbi:unnamed protein product [Tetraodon nigroviridis]|uniref:Chromosome 8 SCAF15119, whole genome shotgun sequence n=1 Tax=Tetraodon nigroviridis TaxID=99883 RepID=Q4RFE7_TETNG|nr:unnamed protein product [Tetraodon nigroviridis]
MHGRMLHICALMRSASFVASLMPAPAPVAGPSHTPRPRPPPVHQHKGWRGRGHALSQRHNLQQPSPASLHPLLSEHCR